MHKPLLSIVVPIYGVEKYLEQCIRSLFEQTYKNIEYIFVNDCTQDSSMDILYSVLNDYPERSQQIIIINHSTNKGLARSRFDGFLAAKGDFIASCDSDDWVDIDMYERLIQKAIDCDADVVLVDYMLHMSPNDELHCSTYKDNTNDALSDLFMGRASPCVHMCIFNRSYMDLQYVTLPSSDMAEDLVYSVCLLFHANGISHISLPLYHYRYNLNSISKAIDIASCRKRGIGIFNNTNQIIEFLHNQGVLEKYEDEVLNLKHVAKISLMPALYDSSVYAQWKKIYPEIVPKVVFSNRFSWRTRVLYLFATIGLYPLLLKIKYARAK